MASASRILSQWCDTADHSERPLLAVYCRMRQTLNGQKQSYPKSCFGPKMADL